MKFYRKNIELLFLFLMLVFIFGCTQAQINETTTTTITTTSSTTSTTDSNYVSLEAEINITQDENGNILYLGEVHNTYEANVAYGGYALLYNNPVTGLTDTHVGHIIGSYLKTNNSSDNNTCLRPDEYGAFKISTDILFSELGNCDVETFGFLITFPEPDCSFEVFEMQESVSEYSGNLKYLGKIKNISLTNANNVEIFFITKNSQGKVVDISYSHVLGFDINSQETKSFSVTTLINSTEASSYYYKLDWNE